MRRTQELRLIGMLVLMLAAAWLPQTVCGALETWDYSFEGEDNPIYTGVPWVQQRYSTLPGSSDGDIYTIDTQTAGQVAGHYLYYNLADTAYFDGASTNGTVVEWRMRLDYYSDMTYIDIGDGTKIYNFAVAWNALHGPDVSVSMDTYTDFHIYRAEITTPGGPANVYVDDIYQGTHSGYNGSMNGIKFGDVSTSRMSIAYWDYVRWAEVPEPTTVVLLSLGTLLLRKRRVR